MNAFDSLRLLAAGERPEDALLPPVRLFAGGAEYFGEEAVVHAFRGAPLAFGDAAEVIRADGHIAIFDGENALFALLHGDRIARIWRLGGGDPGDAEPAIGVAFDTDLRQARSDVAFRAEDHPALAAAGAHAVETIGRRLAHGADPDDAAGGPYRVRPFAIEAFSEGDRGAVLFATFRLGGEIVRSSGFSFIGVSFALGSDADSAPRIVRDRAGEQSVAQRPWRTQFV